MRKDGFTVCANNYVECLRREGRYAIQHMFMKMRYALSLCFVGHRVCHSAKLLVRT